MQPILKLDAVSRQFRNAPDFAQRIADMLTRQNSEQVVRAVDGINLDIRSGEIIGLVGESGCGKSTLARIISGILPPSNGRILLEGRDVATMSEADRRKASLSIQMVFQDASFAQSAQADHGDHRGSRCRTRHHPGRRHGRLCLRSDAPRRSRPCQP